jgi:outer membrane protein
MEKTIQWIKKNKFNMRIFLISLFLSLNFNTTILANDLIFFLESAYKNNPKLKAERENLKATKENINISRSEFLPSVTITGTLDNSQSTDRTNQSGSSLTDLSNDTVTQSVSVDQKIFQGFEGYNSLKKSKLEVEQANYKLKNIEQEIILKSITAYYDLVYKTKSREFNFANLALLERQVESDRSRLQRGEISLTDLSQSESSLAGANASFIVSGNQLLVARTDFERIIRTSIPEEIDDQFILNVTLPNNLNDALKLAENNNPKLMIAQLDYKISERDLNIERAKLSPSASINYTKSKSEDYSSTVDEIEKESIKATITWPIIKGGENYSSLKKAKFKKNKSNLILEDTFNQVKSDTANAWSLYQSAESVLNSTQSQVNAAEIANEGITLEYDSGNTRTTLEVIQSRSLLLNARITNAKAERDFIVSKFELLAELGELTLKNIKKS